MRAGLLFILLGITFMCWGFIFPFLPLAFVGAITFSAGYTKLSISRYIEK